MNLEAKFQEIALLSTEEEVLEQLQNIEEQANTPWNESLKLGYSLRLADIYAQELDGFNDKSTARYLQAIEALKNTSDLGIQIWVNTKVGFYYYSDNQYTEAYSYFLKSAHGINQLRDTELFNACEVLKLNGYFFQTITEYDTSIDFLNRAIYLTSSNPKEQATLLNSQGLNYFNKSNFNTATQYLLRSKERALVANDTIRYAKVLGDLARIEIKRGNWDKAERLLLEDIDLSIQLKEFRNEMFAKLQLGELYLRKGEIAQAKQALVEVQHYAASKSYLKLYEFKSTEFLLEIALIEKDQQQELALRRALEKLETQIMSKYEKSIDRVALDYQKKNVEWELELQKIKLDKSILQQRTWLIICFLLVIIVLLIVILQRRRIKLNAIAFQNKILGFENEKMQMETKLGEANNTLESFHTYIDRKNEQISQLEQEIKRITNRDQKHSLEDLLVSHLMTDDNWLLFKKAFREEKKDYYASLIHRFPDLTESNLRIILLSNLGLNNQEIAQIIGITSDAVKKSKQRLRKKYSEKNTQELELLNL